MGAEINRELKVEVESFYGQSLPNPNGRHVEIRKSTEL